MVTWRAVLVEASGRLGQAQEARWIVESAGGSSPATLLAMIDEDIPADAIDRVRSMVDRRLAGEPLQHVLRLWQFRNLDVVVDGRALVPRPETELLVEVTINELDRLWVAGTNRSGDHLLVADLGTGSGVIALSLAAERGYVEVVGVDRSAAALALARENLSLLDADLARRVRLAEGDWFSGLPPEWAGRVALVASNPPYLAASEWPGLDPVVRDFDPYESLVSGATGLEAISLLVAVAPEWLAPEGSLAVEIAPHQSQDALDLVAGAGSAYTDARVVPDLAGRPRILLARRSTS